MSRIKKTDHFYLIDGSGYIFRAYYALPPLSRKSDGLPTGAINGFCNMLFKLLENVKETDSKYIATHFAVIFDSARENFRNKIYKDYKANRAEAPEDLIPQFDLIKQSVQAFNIPQLELEGYEADDLIATYTCQATKLNIPSLIISSDKDLMQLVNDQVEMLDPMKNKRIGINEVIEKFGVKPNKVIQIQALTGDKIDNIPGAPGIGPKTALELIKQFGDIEELFKNIENIKQEKRKNAIRDSEKDIRVSLELVKLDNKVKLPVSIDEIIPYSAMQNNLENINQFLLEQGFKAIIQRLENNSFIKTTTDQSLKNTEKPEIKYITVTKTNELDLLLDKISKIGICAIDTETDSLDIETANLVGISLCFNESFAYYIPINHKESVNKKVTVKEIKSWMKSLEEFRYRKIPNVDARRITSFVNNGLSETDLPQSLQKKWESAKYSKEKGLADRFMKERINKRLTQNESKHPIKERYDRLFKNKVVL